MARILVIDDSEVITQLVRDFLTAHGYDVECAASAEEAYQAVKRQKPDLILLDIQLPDVSGFELCKHFRSHAETRSIPIIMISATATQTQDKVLGLQSGADDYLSKPFEVTELLERVRAVMRRQAKSSSKTADASDLIQSLDPLSDATVPAARTMTVLEAIRRGLLDPFSLPAEPAPVSLAFLIAALLLLIAGLAGASSVSLKPVMICLLALVMWGFLVSTLVVGCSLVGIDLKWKPGAHLWSLAALPLLLKLAGGAVFAALTSLSPFLYTASLALFLKSAPFIAHRLDVFEVWTVFLLGIFLQRRPGASRMKTIALVLLVWMIAIGFLFCVQRFGGSA